MNIFENISRVKNLMNLNELGGGTIQDFQKYYFNKGLPDWAFDGKKFNPNNEKDFSKSKVKDIVWRAGSLDLNPKSGGLWFSETKKGVEDFAMSVRREKREGKPYRINLENPLHMDAFWHGYVNQAERYSDRGAFMRDLMSSGYDGIIIDEDTWNDTGDEYSVRSKQYVVFDPDNVKPA